MVWCGVKLVGLSECGRDKLDNKQQGGHQDDDDSCFHNDRNLCFLLVYVLFGSIRESGTKEASSQQPAMEASQPQSLLHAADQ